MEMSNIRAESHVAQQSRRDKLRIQQTSDPAQHHLGDFSNNLEQLPVHHPGLSPDLMQVRNVRNANLLYNPGLISSEMLNYSTNSNNLAVLKDIMVNQELGAAQCDTHVEAVDAPFTNSSHPVCTSSNNKATRNMQNFGIWRSLGSQQSCDWIANYASGSAVTGSHQNPMIVEDLPNSMKVNNMSPSIPYLKPSNGFLDVQSTLTNPSSEISNQEIQEHWKEMLFGSRLYQSTLQEVVTSGKIVQNGETGRNSWAGGGNELVLLPQFENESNALRVSYASALMNRPVVACLQSSDPSRSIANKNDGNSRTVASDANTQALSLSLSSEGQFCERYGAEALPSRTDIPQDAKTTKSGYLCSNSKPIMSNKGYENSLQDITGTSYTRQHAGPLGPFTGYATILKSSKFLRPAQQLLVEFCSVADPNFLKKCELSERISGDVSGGMAVNAAKNEVGIKGGNSAVSSSTFHSSNEVSGEVGVGSCSSESHRPEYQQKKAKLLFMQEEVCRRYKHYHQQMQMVVSSFESVAGLSAATPYISFALKAVSRHFRSLKNAISDQLRDIKKALGEDLSSPTTGTSSSRGDITTSKLKFIDHGFPKPKYGGSNMGFLESQQHIWRPQRGLPERAVAVLRAWLFEHFLHPYPTDTDKHMLATQTGLTRNQVSNWFINARVRVWKPMVEEIHMLETKGLAETDVHSGKNDRATVTEGTKWPNGDHPIDEIRMNAISDKKWERSGLGNSSVGTGDELGVERWDQEKRSRVEGHIPGGMDGSGSLMSFVPYHRNGLEIGGLGTVSLTLGLRQSAERHSVETAQQPQLLPQGHHLRQHFGGQMIRDFVG